MGHIKQKSALKPVQNVQIQIILRMHKVSFQPVLFIQTSCSIHGFC